MRRRMLAAALCLLLCACAPAETPPAEQPNPPPSETVTLPEEITETGGLAVYTDWSKLEEREPPPEPIGTRWYEDYTAELLPREDYGPLVPYAGLRLMDDWPSENGCIFGLMTLDGVVVTDPVYSNVHAPAGYGEDGKPYVHPLLIIKQGDAGADEESWDPAAYAVAARDGSWRTPFDYCAVAASGRGLLLFREDSVTVMTPGGEIQRIWTVAEMGIEQIEFDEMLGHLSWGEGYCGERRGDYMALGWEPESDYEKLRTFDLVSGGIKVFHWEEWDALVTVPDQTHWDAETAVPDAELLTDKLLGYEAPGLLCLADYSGSGVSITYYRQDGTPLPDLTRNTSHWYQQVKVVGGLIEVLDRNTAAYYDMETMECVFRTYLGYEGD